jgi:PleD family two-component response regulator
MFGSHSCQHRSDDWAARYGGEEIYVVMHGTAPVAQPVLERIRSPWRRPFALARLGIEITVSGGAAERDGDETLLALMERVSGNLLLAKQGGRNRIVT